MNDLFDLKGEVALCTGGSSGIGQRMAVALANAGADVVLVGRQEDALKEAVQAINAQGKGKAESVAADLLDREGLVDVVAQATKYFGSPTILTNAAGVNLRQPVDEITSETWDITLNINLATPFFLARACVPGMLKKGRGKIINVASLQSYRAFANSIPYGASKGGIAQVTRAMAEAWSGQGIMANAIAPGFFRTALTAKVYDNADLVEHNAKMTAIGRNGEVEDIDGLTVFLAARASDYITGQVISLDGGYTAK
ncbi:MAG: SDR family oxidoreductase [Methylocystaceae bacterium]|nr:SDR family oxidoreductase [Methylocystaceae bacterium]